MNGVTAKPRMDELLALMSTLEELHGELAEVAERRMDAMRRADLEAMAALSVRDAELARRLRETEEARRGVLERIGSTTVRNGGRNRMPTVSQLSLILDEGERARLMDAAKRLRAAVFRSGRLHRLAGSVAREVLDHLRWVFASMREKGVGESGYGVTGQGRRILDAVA